MEMELVGYSDPLGVRPGERISFMISSRRDRYRAGVVRLVHGDENPLGPGFVEEEIGSTADGEYPGRYQPIASGSHVRVADRPALRPAALTIVVHLLPTTPDRGRQAVLTKWSEADRAGYGIFLGDGSPEFLVAAGDGVLTARTGEPLASHRWHLLVASYDPASGEAALHHVPLERAGIGAGAVHHATAAAPSGSAIRHSVGPLLMAAAWSGEGDGPAAAVHHFNGKIGSPRLLSFAAPLDRARAAASADAVPTDPGVAAVWDLGAAHDTVAVIDRSANLADGQTVNMPTRAVTGHRWNGDAVHYDHAPDHYDAIHFHDDDLDDAGWEPGVTWDIPAGLRSGVYALRVRSVAGEPAEDHVPFFVLPTPGEEAEVAFLASTCSYYAYANERLEDAGRTPRTPRYRGDQDRYEYMVNHRLLSIYDYHSDGTGVCHSSRLRPNLTMRPKHRMRLNDTPHVFSADLHVTEWLEHEGHRYDVITDEALHFEGRGLLDPYRVVLSGTHPEYWSGEMLDALETYLAGGGRFMYLGGNGLYWVTAFHPDRPHVIEIRRPPGTTRAWETWPGEDNLASTGERGGLWRHRGRAPQGIVGVGFTAQGFDRNAPYHVSPDLDPRVAFVLDGVDLGDGTIGDQPSLVFGHGAAGFELDRVDHELGTPTGTFVLASSRHGDYSDSYQHVIEETMMANSLQGGPVNPKVKADLVIVPYPNGGAVFSTGSIAWSGGLAVLDYESDVAKVTRNVLEAFLRDDWLDAS